MSRERPARRLMGMAILPVLALVLILGRPALAAEEPRPKCLEHPKGTVVMYQPQLEDFKDDQLMARAAVSVKKKEWKAPVFGAVWLSGRVLTDRDTRMARITPNWPTCALRGGIESYLAVLDADRQIFSAQLDLATVQRDQLLTIVQLYKARGGG